MTLNPMQMVRNYYGQGQDVLSDESKNRLVNVYRQGSQLGSHMTGNLSREQQVEQGQDALHGMQDRMTRKNALDADLDIHIHQQQPLRNLRR